jgi:hypothetical protein
MSTTETPPRFQRRTARGHAQELDAPLPATVAELDGVQQANRKHRELAVRVAAAKQALADAHRELTEAEAADRERQIAAARAGRQSPSQRATAQAKAKVEESESVLDVLAEALIRSADELLGIAAPHFEEAAVALSEAHDAAIDRGRGLVAAAAEEFAHAAQLATENAWIVAASRGTRSVSPFRPSSGDPTLMQLGAQLRELVAELDHQREAAARERERVAAWEAENRPTWERQEAEARRRAEASRVVIDSEGHVEPVGVAVPEEPEAA